MNKFKLIPVIAAVSFFFFACNNEAPVVEETIEVEESTPIIEEDAPKVVTDSYESKEGGFAVVFPGEPTTDSEMVDTEVGPVNLSTYIYEDGLTKAYMVSYTDYPEEIVTAASSNDLLEGGMNGALGSLGIGEAEEVNNMELDGYKGLFFKGKDQSNLYVKYKLILKENRLYQIAILQEDGYPESKADVTFFDTFRFVE